LDDLQFGHNLPFDITGKKCFRITANYHAKDRYTIIPPKVIFFLASNSLCLDNVVKCKAMLPFLRYVKGLLSTVAILTLIFEIMQSFWAWYFVAESSMYFSDMLSLKKMLPFISFEVPCLLSLCL